MRCHRSHKPLKLVHCVSFINEGKKQTNKQTRTKQSALQALERDKVRDLGVILDKNLSLSNHINEVCKIVTLTIQSIGRIRKYQ